MLLLRVICSASAVLVLVLLYPAGAHAQEAPSPRKAALQAQQKAMGEAFSAGDARAVLAEAAERVEVGLPQGSSQYSRSQAIYVLQNFFETHAPGRFAWQGTSQQGHNCFLMGRYWQAGAEQPLAVYVHLSGPEEPGQQWKVQEVRLKRP